MSGPGFGLVIGAQTKAAGYVVDFESKLVDVAEMLESCILDDVARVNGPYVSVLSDALQRWGEGSNAHQADLERAMQAMISINEVLVAAEEETSGNLNDIADHALNAGIIADPGAIRVWIAAMRDRGSDVESIAWSLQESSVSGWSGWEVGRSDWIASF